MSRASRTDREQGGVAVHPRPLSHSLASGRSSPIRSQHNTTHVLGTHTHTTPPEYEPSLAPQPAVAIPMTNENLCRVAAATMQRVIRTCSLTEDQLLTLQTWEGSKLVWSGGLSLLLLDYLYKRVRILQIAGYMRHTNSSTPSSSVHTTVRLSHGVWCPPYAVLLSWLSATFQPHIVYFCSVRRPVLMSYTNPRVRSFSSCLI